MRVVTQEATIERNRRIAQFSFIFSLVALAAAFFFGNSLASSESSAAFYFNCGILPALFMVIIFSVRMANNWIREPVPWTSIQEAVRGLSSNAVLYHFIFPARHVLFSPMGVFIIYPLFQERRIVVRDDRWRMPGSIFSGILTFMRQEGLGDPVRDATIEAQFMQRFLIKRFPDTAIEVQPIIFIVNPKTEVEIQGAPSLPVTFATEEQGTTLKEYLKSQKDSDRYTLSEEEIDQLDDEMIYISG